MRWTILMLAGLTACDAPSATHVGTDFHAIDLQTAQGEVRFALKNPWPVAVNITELTYALQVADQPLVTGERWDGLRIGRWEEVEVALPITLSWAALREAAGEAAGPDDVPWSVQGEVGLSSWFGARQIPLHYAGELPVLRRPQVGLEEVRFGRGPEGGVGMALELRLRRNGGMRWGVDDLGWTVALADTPIAAGRAHTWLIDPSTTALRLEVLVDPFHAASQATALLLGYPVRASVRLMAQFTTPLGSFPLDTTLQQELQWR